MPVAGRKGRPAPRKKKPMRSPSLKLKLTYKLDRKETQVPSSSTFGDLKVRWKAAISSPDIMRHDHSDHICFFLCSLQHPSFSVCHQMALHCCIVAGRRETTRSSPCPA